MRKEIDMPIISTSTTLTTTPIKVLDEVRSRRWVVFSNDTGTKIHVGGPTIVSNTGIPVNNGESFVVQQQHENDHSSAQEWWARTDNSSGPIIITYSTEDSTD